MAEFGFPRSSRLLESAEFKAVFDDAGIKVSSRHFLMLARHSDYGDTRLGMIVSKKNVARATGRNRIKRQVREFFRHRQPVGHSLDLVVLARRDADTLSNPEIRHTLHQLWQDVVAKSQA